MTVNIPPALGEAFVFLLRGDSMSGMNYDNTRQFAGSSFTARAAEMTATRLPEDERSFVSEFAVKKFNDATEREGELVRRNLAPERCSRLGGVFVFADLDSCARVSALHRWDLSEMRRGQAIGEWRRYDMQIISALNPPQVPPPDVREQLWATYWRGEPGKAWPGWHELVGEQPQHIEPLWEWLVDGFVVFEQDDRSPFD